MSELFSDELTAMFDKVKMTSADIEPGAGAKRTTSDHRDAKY